MAKKTTPDLSFQKGSQSKDVMRRFFKNKPAVAGTVILILILSAFLISWIMIPEEACYTVKAVPFQKPSLEHWFGTDHIGRDVFARVMYGARVSMTIGIVSTVISAAIGALIGATCGYFGGRVDNVVMRFFDILACIPGMLMIIALVAALGVGVGNLMVAMVVSMVPGFVRFVCATVLNLTDMEYI